MFFDAIYMALKIVVLSKRRSGHFLFVPLADPNRAALHQFRHAPLAPPRLTSPSMNPSRRAQLRRAPFSCGARVGCPGFQLAKFFPRREQLTKLFGSSYNIRRFLSMGFDETVGISLYQAHSGGIGMAWTTVAGGIALDAMGASDSNLATTHEVLRGSEQR